MIHWKTKAQRAAFTLLLAGTFTGGMAVSESATPSDGPAQKKSLGARPEKGTCPQGAKDGRGHRPPPFEDLDTNGDGKLSKDEAADIPPVQQEGFDTLDENSDGYLSKEELPPPPDHGARGPGGRGGHRPPPFEDLDTNGDGKLSPEEAADIPPVQHEGFEAFDADKDGYLTQEELPPPPGRGGRGGPEGNGPGGGRGGDGPRGHRPPSFEDLDASGDGKLSPDEAADIPPVQDEGFDAFDDNGDGYLSEDELPPPPHHEHGPQARAGGPGERGGERGDQRGGHRPPPSDAPAR